VAVPREPLFAGVGVALVTLFDADGELDTAATAAHAKRLVDRGVRGVVVAGSTGEAAALSAAERRELVEAVRAAVPPEVSVLAGTGAPTRRQAAALTADAVAAGAGAVLALSPPGAGRDLAGYYRAVADAAGGLPVLAYHFPGVSPPGIPVDALAALPVQALKDSSADPTRLLAELAGFPDHLYTGSAALLSYAGPLGCRGAILALANLDPEGCAAAFAGDAAAQRALTADHLAVEGSFPAGLKRLLADRAGTSPVCRVD
jgi:4-hydroxy-tetrahydrodipicolinate synthase